ncbi:MAG: hypothetical protein ACLU4J_16160 [Butyricimonas paravirosa]
MFFPLEQERIRYFRLTGTECSIGRLAIHICEMSLQKSSRKGVIVMLAEVFRAVERSFEGYGEGETSGVQAIADSYGYGGCLH